MAGETPSPDKTPSSDRPVGPSKRLANEEFTRFAGQADGHEELELEFDEGDSHPSHPGPLGILGEYLLLERIGAGGMGEVFRAEHRTMNRQVALKILSRSIADRADLLERFFHEIRAVAKLMHPNIVTAFDAGSAGGVHYLVMELVEGELLSKRISREGPLGTNLATDLLAQAARGLEYAHRQGVIHRDIKPSNLMLSQNGTLKILDFGLAQLERPQQLSDANRMFMGTVEYMSPEQVEHPDKVDARSDLYSLGATLFFLLTGRPMFTGEQMQVARAQLRQPPPKLYESRGDIDLRIDAVFQRLVAKSPADRFATAGALLEALSHSNLLGKDRAPTVTTSSLSGLRVLPDRPTAGGTSHSTVSRTLGTLAIDLGMMTSTVAYYDEKVGSVIIDQPGGGQHARNMLWSDGEHVVIGAEAATLRQTQPDKVFHSLQRWIGLKQIERPFGGRMVPPEIPLAAMLRFLVNNSHGVVPGANHVVLTVPACYDQMHRLAVHNACQVAGLELLQLIDKPLAAAMAWIDTNMRLSQSGTPSGSPSGTRVVANNSTLLVVHLGGTGLEASVIDVQGLNASMRGTSGSLKLGTLRWQSRLADFFSERFRTLHNRDIREDIVAAARLQRTVEMALQRLTKSQRVDVKFEWRQASIAEALTQDGLLRLAPNLAESIVQTIHQACLAARVDHADIDHVVMTGGLMRIEALQRLVKQIFPQRQSITFLEKHELAQGAILHAQHLVPLASTGTALPRARSATTFDLGLLIADGQGKSKPRILIHAGSPLPTSVSRSLRSAPADQAPILQMIESTGASQTNWHRLGSLDLRQAFLDLPPQSSLQLRLSVDESGLLTTQVFHTESGRSAVFPALNEGVLPPLSIPSWKAWLETIMLCSVKP
ncbi:MAG: Hsp70 family protein [Pirellulaceae bacterium]|nr:Hsp70 family protein [Pirellulaceae bacterium]